MNSHEYEAARALEVLLRKLRERDEGLAGDVQKAIDAGKDVAEPQPESDKRKKPRVYRKTIPNTPEEALAIAINVLEAKFVEQLFFANSILAQFYKAAIGYPDKKTSHHSSDKDGPEKMRLDGANNEKSVVIELLTETQISRQGMETFSLKRAKDAEIKEMRALLIQVRNLTDFNKA